ncbi:hypothetical protein EAO01_27595, partial [Klebsiella pneumoniae]
MRKMPLWVTSSIRRLLAKIILPIYPAPSECALEPTREGDRERRRMTLGCRLCELDNQFCAQPLRLPFVQHLLKY